MTPEFATLLAYLAGYGAVALAICAVLVRSFNR